MNLMIASFSPTISHVATPSEHTLQVKDPSDVVMRTVRLWHAAKCC